MLPLVTELFKVTPDSISNSKDLFQFLVKNLDGSRLPLVTVGFIISYWYEDWGEFHKLLLLQDKEYGSS